MNHHNGVLRADAHVQETDETLNVNAPAPSVAGGAAKKPTKRRPVSPKERERRAEQRRAALADMKPVAYSIPQIAAKSGLSGSSIKRYIKAGDIKTLQFPALQSGSKRGRMKRTLIAAEEFERFMAAAKR